MRYRQVAADVAGPSYEQLIHDFWLEAAKKAWVDESFYRDLQAKPQDALGKLAKGFTADSDGIEAIERSIHHETQGVWTLQRLPAPPSKPHPGFAVTSVDHVDQDPYALKHVHVYPPTCC